MVLLGVSVESVRMKQSGVNRRIVFRRIRLKSVILPGIPAFILVVMVLAAILAPLIAPHDPNAGKLANQFISPLWMKGGTVDHILGTDYFGRDVLSRLIYGARVSLSVGIIVTIICGLIGTFMGLLAGYKGGMIDSVLMRLVDGWLSFPLILIAILFAVMVGPSYFNVLLILTLMFWPNYARQVRAESVSFMSQECVALARVAGASGWRIMRKYLLPNVTPTVIVIATFGMADVILCEAMLSFLGVGVPPPTASWGSMASDGRDYIATKWWLTASAGLAIFLCVLAVNLLGDWVRDRLDPRLRQL
jgi:peptide/nickel transport system permease protein